MFNSWIIFVALYLTFEILFDQNYKRATKRTENAGAFTVVLEWG